MSWQVVQQRGMLTLSNPPRNAGEKPEVIISPCSEPNQQERERYPFWGKPITYLDPTEPLPETAWEVSAP